MSLRSSYCLQCSVADIDPRAAKKRQLQVSTIPVNSFLPFCLLLFTVSGAYSEWYKAPAPFMFASVHAVSYDVLV